MHISERHQSEGTMPHRPSERDSRLAVSRSSRKSHPLFPSTQPESQAPLGPQPPDLIDHTMSDSAQSAGELGLPWCQIYRSRNAFGRRDVTTGRLLLGVDRRVIERE
jgi:hypothetical protein